MKPVTQLLLVVLLSQNTTKIILIDMIMELTGNTLQT